MMFKARLSALLAAFLIAGSAFGQRSNLSRTMYMPGGSLGAMMDFDSNGYPTLLAPNTTTTLKFLSQIGNGVTAGHPGWARVYYQTFRNGTNPLTQRTYFDVVCTAGCTFADDAGNDASLLTVNAGASNHNLLSAIHPDTLADSVLTGDILIGNATPKWARLPGTIASTVKILSTQGTGAAANPPAWADTTGTLGNVVLSNAPTILNGILKNALFNQIANGDTAITGKRFTDTAPSGHFELFKKADDSTLWDVDITGQLAAGIIPVARLLGPWAASNINGLGTGSVPYMGASGLTDDPGQFGYDGSTHRLCVACSSPAASLETGGDLAARAHTLTLANGGNNNVAIGATTYQLVTGPTAAFYITGIASGTNGKLIVIVNTTDQPMALVPESPNSTAANRIVQWGDAPFYDLGLPKHSSVTLIYSSTSSRWNVVSTFPEPILQGTSGFTAAGVVATAAVATPTFTITNEGTGGSTHYTYEIAALVGTQWSASATVETTGGAATLNGTNFNRLHLTPVAGAGRFAIYRAAAGIPISFGLIGYANIADEHFDDTGLAGDGATVPNASENITGNVGIRTLTPAAPITMGRLDVFGQLMQIPYSLATQTFATGGSLTAGTYYYKVVAQDPRTTAGFTLPSDEISATVGGSTNRILLTWAPIAGAWSYRIFRGTTSGGEHYLGSSNNESFVDTGALTPTEEHPPIIANAYLNIIKGYNGSFFTSDTGSQGIDMNAAGGTADLNLAGNARFEGDVSIPVLSTPSTPTVTPLGTAGVTTYTYEVCAVLATTNYSCSARASTTTGNATLSGNNFNLIGWDVVPGANKYAVYKIAGPGAQGLLTNISEHSRFYKDTTGIGDASTPPAASANTTGKLALTVPLAAASGGFGFAPTFTGSGTVAVLQDAPNILHPRLGATSDAGSAHVETYGSAPTCTFSTGGGTNPSCTVSAGSSDAAGIVLMTTGTGSPGNNGTITLTFNSTYDTNLPAITLTAYKTASSGAWATCPHFGVTTSSLTAPIITWQNYACNATGTNLTTSTTYAFSYRVDQLGHGGGS